MDVLNKIFAAFHAHNWYALVALGLTLVIQLVRTKNVPGLTKLWFKIPDGWRWLGPVLSGGVTGFTTAFANGVPLPGALLAFLGGAFGIGVPAMGLHAGLKESPVHIDGGAGGKPLEPAGNQSITN